MILKTLEAVLGVLFQIGGVTEVVIYVSSKNYLESTCVGLKGV